MAKFAVGEIALYGALVYSKNTKYLNTQCEIMSAPFECDGEMAQLTKSFLDGHTWSTPVKNLRKLPPDDHADTRDTTEDPGLTRIKRLLEQDTLKSPKPVKA